MYLEAESVRDAFSLFIGPQCVETTNDVRCNDVTFYATERFQHYHTGYGMYTLLSIQ